MFNPTKLQITRLKVKGINLRFDESEVITANLLISLHHYPRIIVGTQTTLFRYTPYIPWGISLAKSLFMNMHEAGETNLLPMKSHVTIKYSISSNLFMPNKSFALAKSLMEVAILNGKPNLRYT